MKKPFEIIRILFAAALVSPVVLAWFPEVSRGLFSALPPEYLLALMGSFRQLSITLVTTVAFATLLSAALGYLSVLSSVFGRSLSSVLEAVESVPAILIALFCYAPVSGYLARHAGQSSQLVSLGVFILAATVTTLPESVRGLSLPLGELYHQKYSVSFRSYGFTRGKILGVLMATGTMRQSVRMTAAGILLKTLVLDCSFGFIIQLGFGSYGTPAHASPGALIAANRDALFQDGRPELFWIPAVMLALVSMAFLIMIRDEKEN